jgi:tetratricopeptide (TPR) repeat protein
MSAAARTAKPAARSSAGHVRLGLSLLLVVCALAAYVPAMQGGFVWDDDDYVTENLNLRSLSGLQRIWLELGAVPQYYPLVHTTFWLEYHLWGLHPFGFHLTNVFLHAANGLILWELLRRLRVPGAWAAAALFVLHPMQVESVAWVTERKNVLSGMFYLLAALAYLGVRDRESDAPGEPSGPRYAVTVLLYLCALLSKSVTATLPAAIAVVLWFLHGRLARRDVLRLGAMLPFGVAAGFLTSWMEKYSVGATGPEWSLTAMDRVIVAGRAFWFYLGKLAWPHPLTFIYPRWDIAHTSPAMLLFPAAALSLLSALWFARRWIGRGPLTAALLYAGTLAPALGFVNVYPMRFSFVADHFAYLAVIGPLALLTAAVATSLQRSRKAGPAVAWGFGAVVLAILGALTWHRGYAYADEETLWRDTLRKNPTSFIANDNLGGILLLRGELEPAAGLFETALRSKPDFPEALDNLGIVRQRQGKPDEAIALFREALRWDPKLVDAHNNLGIALAQQGRSSEAMGHFREALRIQPSFAKAHLNLGLVFEGLLRTSEAVKEYREMLRWTPDAPDVEKRLAWILATDPDDGIRDGNEAVRLAESANAATGGIDFQALNVLAASYAEAGRFDAAVAAAEKALELAKASAGADVRQSAERRLALYREGRAFRSREK